MIRPNILEDDSIVKNLYTTKIYETVYEKTSSFFKIVHENIQQEIGKTLLESSLSLPLPSENSSIGGGGVRFVFGI